MADLMQQARELLAAEFAKDWQRGNCKMIADAILNGDELRGYGIPYALAAIAAALRAAPEGFVLVPVQLDFTMLLAWRMAIARGESYQQAWTAMLAARPQGVNNG